jgi:hypothetical protein
VLNKLLEEKGNPFRLVIAFSGIKKIKGIEFTEDSMNIFPANLDTTKPTDSGYISDKIARYFDKDEYRILVVANKYLTGFDQPKLTAMYADKKLQGVMESKLFLDSIVQQISWVRKRRTSLSWIFIIRQRISKSPLIHSILQLP